MAKIYAEFPDKRRVGMAVDSLKIEGLDRDKMVISDGQEAEPTANIKSEADDLTGHSFAPQGVITVAVEVPEVNVPHIAAILKESGATSLRHE